MSEDPCPSIVVLGAGRRLHFEEYLVRDGAPSDVAGVDLTAAAAAAPAAGVLKAIRGAELIAVCPSNPVVSIGPVLCVAGVRDAIAAAGAWFVARLATPRESRALETARSEPQAATNPASDHR